MPKGACCGGKRTNRMVNGCATRTAAAKRLWYTAKPEESDFGLSYFGARWYDANLGRFLGMDPVGFQEENIHSFNRYAYANNNPYRYVDPDGNESIDSVDYRLRTGMQLAHPAGGNGSSFPALVQPVPGYAPPMSGGALAAEALGLAGVAGGIKELVSAGVKLLVTGAKKTSSLALGTLKKFLTK